MFANDYMIIKLWREGNSLRETGKRLRISKDTVKRALNRHNFDTSQPYFETVLRENDTRGTSFDTSEKVSQGEAKAGGSVGVKFIFLTLALILVAYLIYLFISYLKKRERDGQDLESEKIKKTFDFQGRSVEELQKSTGFDLPGEDIPGDEF